MYSYAMDAIKTHSGTVNERLVRQLMCRGALLTALNCTICILISISYHFHLIKIAPISVLMLHMMYRDHSWRRCLRWWFAALLHVVTLVVILKMAVNSVPLLITLLCLYYFVVSYLFACEFSLFGTIGIATLTPFLFMKSLENTPMIMHYARYWLIQMSLAVFLTFIFGAFRKTHYYQHLLFSKVHQWMVVIKSGIYRQGVSKLISNIDFQRQNELINEIYPHHMGRRHFWLSLSLYFRSLSMLLRVFHHCADKDKVDDLTKALSASINEKDISMQTDLSEKIVAARESFHKDFIVKENSSAKDYINFSLLIVLLNQIYLGLANLSKYYKKYSQNAVAPTVKGMKVSEFKQVK